MGPEDYKGLAYARYEMMDPDLVVNIVGRGSFNKDQVLSEIKEGTEVGKTLVDMQERLVKFIMQRRGEIDVKK
jgi:hypothetical protein